MKITFNKQKNTETLIYIFIWLLIILVITFLSQNEPQFKWQSLYHNIVWFIPFFIIFLINNMYLTPHLLFKKKYILYFSITSAIILIVSFPKTTQLFHDLMPKTLKQNKLQPPLQRGLFTPVDHPHNFKNGLRNTSKYFLYGRYLINILLSFLVVGFNTAIKQGYRLLKEERIRYHLQEEKLQAELAFLKHQISPHFLMNTLNNIHALVELDIKKAQNSIIRLSHMLRYLLYEKEDKKTSLLKEIEFIKSYTHLMSMRYSDTLIVQINIPDEIPKVSIPPFIFITILENAFKHGAAPQVECFIHFDISVKDCYLVTSCKNSIQDTESIPQAESGGIGITNTKKRLELFYGDNYIWKISNENNIYNSTIRLPICKDNESQTI